MVAGVAAYALSAALARFPALAEGGYALHVSPLVARPLSLFSGLFPFALSEVLLGAYVLWTLAALTAGARAVRARRRGPLHALGGGALRVGRDAGVFVVLLYALWGFNYARPPLEERLGWPEWQGARLEEVVRLAEASVTATNRAYLALHGRPDAGVPTTLLGGTASLEGPLDEGWARASARLGLPPSVSAPHGRVKQPFSSPFLARLGLSGVYSPFTAEANVVRGMPGVRVPFSMAHEKAHQRGVAIEAEASFLGFLVCSLSPDPLARYAAASFAQSQLVAALPQRERRRLAGERLPGVVRDFRDLEEYRRRNESVAGTVQSAVNDRYLRANRVPGGIQSYGRSAFLLILYARLYPDAFSPGGAPDAPAG
jgi:hypothetical protein